MNILWITPETPCFPGTAARAALYLLVKELAKIHQITLVSVAASDEEPWIKQMRSFCEKVVSVPYPESVGPAGIHERKKSQVREKLDWLHHELKKFGDPRPARVAAYEEIGNRILDAAQDSLPGNEPYDLLRIEHSELGFLAERLNIAARKVLVFHNVNYLEEQRFSIVTTRPAQKFFARAQARKTAQYEKGVSKEFDLNIVLSEEEKEKLSALSPHSSIEVVPLGVDPTYFSPNGNITEEQGSIVYTALLSHRPHVDAVLYFYKEIFLLVRQRYPHVKLYLVGNRPAAEVQDLGEDPNVIVTGYVDDVRPYIARGCVYVVPIRYAAGIRIKILEALLMEKAVVSTSVGCEGLGLTHGREILVADSARDFAGAITDLFGNEPFRRELGKKGREHVVSNFDYRSIARRHHELYERLVSNKRNAHA